MRPIHPGLSPNLEKEDFLLALNRILQPWWYKSGNETGLLEHWFEDTYKEKAFSFASGRGCLYAILFCLGIQKGDEVLVTGFTCVAVVDAILATGAKPVYVDITKDFILDSKDLRKKITKKSKALILQHTFGISSTTNEIIDIVKSKNIFLIEDAAHGIGISSQGKLLGTSGIAALFSFGRDKAFSSVSGGVVITKNEDLAKKIKAFQQIQAMPSSFWIFQNLFHIISFYALILPFYDFFSFGKLILVVFQKVHLLSKPIDTKELEHFFLYNEQFPSSLAVIALGQLERMDMFNVQRKKHSEYYQERLRKVYPDLITSNAPLLRMPLLVESPSQIKKYARKDNVYLGDWYSNQIDPKGTDKKKLFYTDKSCPTAEYLAKHIVNLPTYPTLSTKDAEKVVTMVLSYAKNSKTN